MQPDGSVGYRARMIDENDTQDFTPWSAEGAARLRASAEEFIAGIRSHVDAVLKVKGPAEIGAVFDAGTIYLLHPAVAYADALFDYTGTEFPLGILQELVDDDAAEDNVDLDEVDDVAAGVSVLSRRDYEVTDASAVVAAGHEAYVRTHPDEASAGSAVNHLGAALSEIAHESGWDRLGHLAGLRPVGAYVGVVPQDETLGSDSDQWPDNMFEHGETLLFEQRDIYR